MNFPIRKNFIETEDSFIQYGQTENFEFIDVGEPRYIDLNVNAPMLAFIDFLLDNQQVNHSRKLYALFDLLGDLGGVKEVGCSGAFLHLLLFN